MIKLIGKTIEKEKNGKVETYYIFNVVNSFKKKNSNEWVNKELASFFVNDFDYENLFKYGIKVYEYKKKENKENESK